MPGTTLTAFFDLAVSPISFDFAVFLSNAELERRRRGCSSLYLVVVPGSAEGFRADDAEYDEENKRWRLQNILLPIAAMMPAPLSITICRNREQAIAIEAAAVDGIFPEGYSVAVPKGGFVWSHLIAAAAQGETIPTYKASAQAKDYMRRWLEERLDGRLAVTITLRESSHAAVRNSNRAAWTEFARGLDTDRYLPVIIRDTETAFDAPLRDFDSLLLCPIAAVNLQLRMALYELAWLNMMNLNGPAELCRLSDRIRYMIVRMINEEWPSTTTVYTASQGFRIGGQLPHATPFQRQIWEADEPDVLRRIFSEMAERIGDASEPAASEPDPSNAEDPIETAARLQMTGRIEEATAIYQSIVQQNPDHADAWHMLAIIAQQAGRADAAEKMVLRAIRLESGRANYFITAGHVMTLLDRLDEAANAFHKAVSLAPMDAGAHADLSELLFRKGDREAAERAMMQALRLAPATVGYYERAGRMLQDVGNAEEAAKFFRRALDLREEAARQAAANSAHMGEIPRLTLTTG